jgi:hypothetical protein
MNGEVKELQILPHLQQIDVNSFKDNESRRGM